MAQSTSSVGDSVLNLVDAFKHSMTPRLKQQLVNYLFKLMVVDIWGYDFYSFVHDDFLNVSLNAMYTLKSAGKSNLLHSLSQCFYRANQDSQPRMALNKMPFGLINYNIRLFASNSVQSVHVEKHYTSWVETMFSHFGHRWLCLFRGPAWQYETHDSNEQTNGKTEHNTVSEERSVPVAPTHISEVATSKDILECAMYESGIHDEIFNESTVDETHDSNKQTNGKTEHNTVSEKRSVPVAPTQISEVATSKDILECAMYESGIHDEIFNEKIVDETHDSSKQSNGKNEHNTVSEERSVPVAPTHRNEVATNKDILECAIHDERFNESTVDETHDSNEQTNGKIEHNTVNEMRSVPVAPTQISQVATNKDILECAMYESGIHDERFDESNVDINSLALLDTCENPEFENSKDYSLMPD